MTHLPTDAAAQPGDLIAHIEKPTQGELSDAVGKIVRSVQGRRTRSRIVSTVTELVANLEEHGPERDDGPFGEVAVYQIDEPDSYLVVATGPRDVATWRSLRHKVEQIGRLQSEEITLHELDRAWSFAAKQRATLGRKRGRGLYWVASNSEDENGTPYLTLEPDNGWFKLSTVIHAQGRSQDPA